MPGNWQLHHFTATRPSPKTPQTTIGTVISSPSVLDALENESIEIFRETAAAFRKPVMLYSIGKDSSVLLHLARKAIATGPTLWWSPNAGQLVLKQ
jgi:3'-phosphoadenosine 5'-phosphosulfate sulfotransferase (PAPS reductase)/FAD synthetase